ncbi:MAG TPA: DUF302 domain-containing protein [Campylobacterales bacterium]|nr:DUF302 domain-containing protein [Campylobacterales bacterium]
MIYKIETNMSKDIIAKELEDKAKAMGFGVLQRYDFKKILKEKGFPIEQEITVFELCNPSGAQQALTAMPDISVYLPCRLSVYEENGKTVLSTIGFEDILNAVTVDEEFQGFMKELFENLKSLMHSWDIK